MGVSTGEIRFRRPSGALERPIEEISMHELVALARDVRQQGLLDDEGNHSNGPRGGRHTPARLCQAALGEGVVQCSQPDLADSGSDAGSSPTGNDHGESATVGV